MNENGCWRNKEWEFALLQDCLIEDMSLSLKRLLFGQLAAKNT